MGLNLFSLKFPTITTAVAAGLTLLCWWLFSFVTPDQPLGVGETALVFLVLLGLSHGVRALWQRLHKKPTPDQES